MSSVIDEIFGAFATRGNGAYLGEPVSQTEHALQAALAAEHAGAPAALIASALLHDFGHLLHDEGDDAADRGIDTDHEDLGADWLGRHFPAAVTEPLRLHVAAKRYLCAVDPSYLDRLSPASQQSLALQGGPLGAAAVRAFEEQPYWREAVELRRYDDVAKIAGLATPPLEHYRSALEAVLGEASATAS